MERVITPLLSITFAIYSCPKGRTRTHTSHYAHTHTTHSDSKPRTVGYYLVITAGMPSDTGVVPVYVLVLIDHVMQSISTIIFFFLIFSTVFRHKAPMSYRGRSQNVLKTKQKNTYFLLPRIYFVIYLRNVYLYIYIYGTYDVSYVYTRDAFGAKIYVTATPILLLLYSRFT